MRLVPLLVILAAPPIAAQELPGESHSMATQDSSGSSVDADDLLAGVAERFGSAIQISYGISDVADLRVDPDFPESPDDTLWRWTTTFKLASLFTSTADLKTAYGNLSKYKEATGATNVTNGLAPRDIDDWVRYFRRTRARDRVARFFSAFAVSGSKSEREETSFGPLGRNGLGDATKWTWDATFDPAVLFTSAEQKADAYSAMKSFITAFPDEVADSDGSATSLEEPLRSLGGLSVGKAVAASLIPVIKLESIDQFDYAMIGGQPILFPDAQDGALQNLTLTWNLLKILRPTQAKAAALTAFKARNELKDTVKTLKKGLLASGARLSVPVDGYVAHPLRAVGDGLNWRKGDSWDIEGLHLTSDGVIIGLVACKSQAPCDRTVTAIVKDAVGRERSVTVVLEVPARPPADR